MNTEEKILSKALEMFNERGIEYVGLREIASTLDMRVSNITYYFPTKDYLVNQLAKDLNRLNSELLAHDKDVTVYSFLEMMKKIFRNQLRYRCMLLSIVHLMEQNKEMSARHKKTQKDRNEIFRVKIMALAKTGYLNINNQKEAKFLASAITLIARFWISEATISFRQLNSEKQISYYLSLIANLLLPYSSAKAKNQIQLFFKK